MKSKVEKRNLFLLSYSIFVIPLILSFFGFIFIFESSSIYSYTNYGDSFYFLKLQGIWFLISLFAYFFFQLFDYRRLYFFAFYLMTAVILLMIIVLVPGIGHEVKGARRWIDFGWFNIQPTEFAKLGVIIYLSSWFVNKERKRFFSFIILLSILCFLIILQPDVGTAFLIGLLSVIMYAIAGNPIFPVLLFAPFGILIFYLLILSAPYRISRLNAFFDPDKDPLGVGYHINQILISLKNGGIFGQGFTGSRQKYLYLPESHTDSIFAILGEDFGFVGSIIVISLYFFLITKIYIYYRSCPERFGKLLLSGVFLFFNLQIIINLAGMVNLIPLTGVSLPFLSYGGSNLFISYLLLGIATNIIRKHKL